MKTICFFVISDGIGGAENVVLKLISGIDRRKFNPICIVNDEIAGQFSPLQLGIPVLNIGRLYQSNRLANRICHAIQPVFDIIKIKLFLRRKIVHGFLRLHACRTINSHLMYDLYVCDLLTTLDPEIRIIYTMHALLNLDGNLKRYVHGHKYFLELISRCAAIVCVSIPIRRMLQLKLRNYSGEVLCISNGVDTDYLKSVGLEARTDDRVVLTFCGGDKEVKGGDILRGAFDILSSKGLMGRFVVNILGPVFPKSVWYDRACPYADSIRVHGFMKKDGLYFAIKNSDLVVMPSRTEGHPIIALETLSLGVPLLGSNIDAFDGILPSAFRFANTPLDLAVMLECFLVDEDFRSAAKDYAQNFKCDDWREVSRKYDQVFAAGE